MQISPWRLSGLVLLAALALLVTARVLGPEADAPPGVAASLPPAPPVPLLTPACTPNWTLVPPDPVATSFYGLSALTAADIWAVGGYNESLTEHWDGTAWQRVPSPNPGQGINSLAGVAALTPANVWAVGYQRGSGPARTLIEHWDGSQWSVSPSPNPGGVDTSDYLSAVAGVAPNDIWAVGYYTPPGQEVPLVVHWDGSTWTQAPTPPVSGDSELKAVGASSSTDAWAVGLQVQGSTYQTLVFHWDGTTWSRVSSPNPSPAVSQLWGVAVRGPGDVWVVGNAQNSAGYADPVAFHWDGSAWTVLPAPNPGTSGARFFAVTAGAGEIWAVGNYRTQNINRPLIEHWNGAGWAVASSPRAAYGDHMLYGVAATAPDEIWAVGYYSAENQGPWALLAEHYTPVCGTPTPTATAIPTCGPPAGTWDAVAPLPTPVFAAAVAAHNGFLYSFGGMQNANWAMTDAAYRYDPGADSWSAIAPLPAVRGGASAVSDGTYLYILNGAEGAAPRSTLWRYDPRTNQYTTLAPAPHGTIFQAAALLNGQIYRIGGQDQPGWVSTVDVYTISTNTWAPAGTVADYPLAADVLAVQPVGGYLWSAGGRLPYSYWSAKTYRYDPGANQWQDSPLADLPQSRAGAGAALVDGYWVLAGGLAAGYDDGTAQGLALADPAGGWISFPDLPFRRQYAAGATLNGALYLVGGLDGFYGLPDTIRYQPPPCGGPVTPSATPTLPAPATGTPAPVATATGRPTGTAGPPTRTPWPPSPPPPPPSPTQGPPSGTPPPPSPTAVPSATATPCAGSFSDVQPSDYFYTAVSYLYCRGVISGYGSTFRPYNPTTRAQQVKILVLGFALPIQTPSPGAYTFADVPPSQAFFAVIETAAAAGLATGYDCGGAGEPCDAAHRRYFRPNANVTRGQLSKLTVLAAGWALQIPATPTFSDVLPGSAFYAFVETAVCQGLVSGYGDGTFHPGASATRGQISKIVYRALTTPGGCRAAPARR